jgi:hypothetical protein
MRNETVPYDLLNEEDPEGFEPWEESDWVVCWEPALALYDEYPWASFCPVRVHPDFAERVWAAVQDRFGAGEQDEWAGHNLKAWHRVCHGGDFE